MIKLKQFLSKILIFGLLFNNIIVNAAGTASSVAQQQVSGYLENGGSFMSQSAGTSNTTNGVRLTGNNTGAIIYKEETGAPPITTDGGISMDGSGLYLNINSGAILELNGSGIYMTGTNNSININSGSALKVKSDISNKIGIININSGSCYLNESKSSNGFEKLNLNNGEFTYKGYNQNTISKITTNTGTSNKIIIDNNGGIIANDIIANGDLDIFISGYDFDETNTITNTGNRNSHLSYDNNNYYISNFGASLKNTQTSGTTSNNGNLQISLTGTITGFNDSIYQFNFCELNYLGACLKNTDGKDIIKFLTGAYNNNNREISLNISNYSRIKILSAEIVKKLGEKIKLRIPLFNYPDNMNFKIFKTINLNLYNDRTPLNTSGNLGYLSKGGGREEIIYSSGGIFTFTGFLNENYNFRINNPLKIKDGDNTRETNYITLNPNFPIHIDNNKDINIFLKDSSTSSDFISLTGTITGLNGKEVIFWGQNQNNNYREFNLGILNSNEKTYEIKIPKNSGQMKIGIKKPIGDNSIWIDTKAIYVYVGQNNIGSINFEPTIPTKTLEIIVKDQKNNLLSGALVRVSSSDGIGFSKETNSYGKAIFNLSNGTYKFIANIKGLGQSLEKSITISSTKNNYSDELIIQKPDLEISGQVLYDSGGVSGVNMYAYNADSKAFLNTFTDDNGNYKFFVKSGNWKIGGFHQNYGALDEVTLNSVNSNQIQNILISSIEELGNLTGSINIGNSSGSGVSGVNIIAIPQNGDRSKGGSAFSDENGNYNLNLKSGNYTLKAFSNLYGNIGNKDVVIGTGNNTSANFVVNTPKNITITFSGAGMNNINSNNFKWIIDVFDKTDKVGFSKTISSLTGYTFENIPSGHTYSIKIKILGIGNVYKGDLLLNDNKNIEVILGNENKMLVLNGIIYQTGTTTPLQDAVVEFRNLNSKQVFSSKTSSGGIYTIKTTVGVNYEIISKKNNYESSLIITGSILETTTSLPNIYLNPVSSTINITGNITNTSALDSKIFISLKGINNDGSDNSKWFGREVYLSGQSFIFEGVPANFGTGKIFVGAEGFTVYKDIIRNFSSSNIALGDITLTSINSPKPKIISITPSLGGIFEDEETNLKMTLPSNALGNTLYTASLKSKETTFIPHVSGSEVIGGIAHEISATDNDGNPITNLSNDVTIEMTFSGSELVSSKSGITLEEVKNMGIYYYDTTTFSWISLPTILTSSSGSLFDNFSGSILLSNVPGYANITFTLKASTDHFTLFTSLVSSAVNNSTTTTTNTTSTTTTSGGSSGGGGGGGGSSGGSSSGGGVSNTSIVSGILSTKDKITSYLGNTTQSIKLLVGKNIDDVLYIERAGKKIFLKDILADTSKSVTSLGTNLVAFGVGDIISTTADGSLSISIDGYTKLDIASNSKVKISEVANNFLTYENLSGKIKYDFTKKTGSGFTYKIKGKTSYATIRGTIIEVNSDGQKDTYNLIEGKIDVYNDKLKKNVSMNSGDKLIVYSDGKEDLSGITTTIVSSDDSLDSSTLNNIVSNNDSLESENIKDIENEKKDEEVKSELIIDKALIGKKDELGNTIKFIYDDVSEKEWYFKYVNTLNNKGIIANNSKFLPDNNISRIELLKMVSLSAGINGEFDGRYVYFDIKDKNYWGSKYVCSAKKLGFISGDNPNFRPSDNITRAEALKLIMSFKKLKVEYYSNYLFSDIKESDWWTKYITTASKMGIVDNKNKLFYPTNSITRKEVAKMIYNVFYK